MNAKSIARKLLVLGFAFALAAAAPGQLLAQEAGDFEIMGGWKPPSPPKTDCDCSDPDDSHKVKVIVPTVNWLQVGPDLEICLEFDPSAQSFKTMTAEASYSFFTNENKTKKITAKLSTALPSGIKMEVKAADPDGSGSATSNGWVELNTNAKTVVSGIKQQSASDKTLEYRVGPKNGTTMLTPGTTIVNVLYTLTD
ncbi:MAG: hypothetical protein BAA04_13040 [Firmicutes bacterium ZCTH02-B6]|nr:MAG: hypothetical protein BAA04_13040 [Firmicutes bacterium ZCTH02-B6]